MTRIEINDLQTEILHRLERNGPAETLELCRDGEIIGHILFLGKLKPPFVSPEPLTPGQTTDLPCFFDPLPDELLDAFEGKGA
jgi:hypothetical protein